MIGGGISGLATAYAVQELAGRAGQSHDISVLECQKDLGGKIKSRIIEGFLCEYGPPGFLDNKPPVLDTVNRLELGSDLLVSKDAYRNRYVFVDGRLQLLPKSPPGFIRTKIISWPAKLRALWEFRTKPGEAGRDETIAEFARRHLGNEIADKLVAAMVVGIFAGDSEKLSLKSCFPVMLDLEKEGGGSLLRAQMRRQKAKRAQAKNEGTQTENDQPKTEGMVGPSGKLTTFKHGMGRIIERLKQGLKGKIVMDFEVVSVSVEDGRYVIEGRGGERIESDAVILAVPSYAGARIIRDLKEEAAKLMDEIPYVPVNVVISGYQTEGFGHDLNGFGFLAPKRERRGILGCLWTSSVFDGQAPPGKVALRTMIGGATNPEAAALNDKETTELATKELGETMGITAEPEFIKIIRHQRAIPQYVIGHSDRVTRIGDLIEDLPGLFVTGNAYRGIGFNDCVVNAWQIAERIVAYLANAKIPAAK